MKKLLSLLLVGVMSVMLLAGCGTTGGGQEIILIPVPMKQRSPSLLRRAPIFLWALPPAFSPMRLHIT